MRRTLWWLAMGWTMAASSVVTTTRTAWAEGASVGAATPEQAEQAGDKFRAGMEAFDAQKLTEALALFRESYGIVASPNSHLMVGRTLAKLGKVADAYREIEASIVEANSATEREKYRKTADAARNERDELRGKVGFVVVELQAEVTLGGRPVTTAELGRAVAVDPGKTEVVLRTAAGAEEHRSVDVLAGSEVRIDLAPPGTAPVAVAAAPCPPPAPPRREGIDQRVLAVVSGGVGLAGFATFAVFGILDQKAYSKLEDQCPTGICSRTLSADAERGRTYQTLANVGLGVGVVGVATGLVLLLTAPSEPSAERAVGLSPELAVGPSRVELKGRF